MHILDRLSKDLAELMEREWVKPNANPDRLYISLLLLLGWRRETGKTSTTQHPDRRVDEEDRLDAADEAEEQEEENDDEPNTESLEVLKEQTQAFRQRNPYIAGLLFRDFYAAPHTLLESHFLPGFGTVKIHAEASRYVNEVLWLKPLGLAKSNGETPTNPHLLLKRLCQLSRAVGEWAATDIRRLAQASSMPATWFHKPALALRAQRQRQGDNIGATARNRRTASGPYWLLAGACAEEVGEELSLRDVAEITPAPLSTGFSLDKDFSKLLKSVVNSLNTRYVWLRACGLLPQDWLHQDTPSIDRLKALAHLREEASVTQDWQDGDKERAFRLAFDNLLRNGGKGNLGGFETFNEWLDSEEGQAMLYRGSSQVVSLSDILGDEGEGQSFDGGDGNADPAGDVEALATLAEIHRDAGPRLVLNPLLDRFFRQVLLQGREVEGPGGLLEDEGFKALLDEDPRYASLAADEAAVRLFYAARSLIANVLLETHPEPVAPLVEAYFRWVVVEEKPVRGKDGLFNRKSFKALLAQDADYAGLAADALNDRLQAEASRLLKKLLAVRG